jgi:hypothetical protein
MESARSGETKNSTGRKWPLGLLIILLALAGILAAWLFLGWMIIKIVLGAVYLVFKAFAAPFRSLSH